MRIIFPILSLLLMGCPGKQSNLPDKFYDIQLDNKSNTAIKAYLGGPDNEFRFPDTLIETSRPIFRTVKPGQDTHFDAREPWEKIYEQYFFSDTMSIFIFHADTLAHYDWHTIKDEYKVLQRYDLSIENLQELDYKITYPPDSRMKNVHRYP